MWLICKCFKVDTDFWWPFNQHIKISFFDFVVCRFFEILIGIQPAKEVVRDKCRPTNTPQKLSLFFSFLFLSLSLSFNFSLSFFVVELFNEDKFLTWILI